MKTQTALPIFHLPHLFEHSEWLALQGDKYGQTFTEVFDPRAAALLVWDGVYTPKTKPLIDRILGELTPQQTILVMGEVSTLLRDHRFVKLYASAKFKLLEINGWNVLPEDILSVLPEVKRV